MPEQYRPPRHERGFTLQNAYELRYLVRARCNYCRITHNYLPTDLMAVVGDVTKYVLPGKLRCETCGRKDYMAVEFWKPEAMEIAKGIMIRRLVETWLERKASWQNERLEW